MTRPGGPAVGAPTQKPLEFVPSAKRVLGRLAPDRARVIGVVVLAIASVGLTVLGPRILGWATDVILAGVISAQLPAGATEAEAVATIRASGDNGYADVISQLSLRPGLGIDLGELGRLLLLALAVYVVASLIGWGQGYLLNDVIQRTMLKLRADVEEKIHRLPLAYFDTHSRGDLLSRTTNDMDNIGQSLQQSLSQLLTSLLTVIGVTVMMFLISPLLAVVALVAVPVALLITRVVAGRSQKLFVAQWARTGSLNGRIEETYTGHDLVRVYGHQAEVEREFEQENQKLYDASAGAQFVSGIIQPLMMFVGNLSYVAIAVVGGLRVASGAITIGDVQAFIQYSRQFTQPLTQVASLVNQLQSGVASAERVFALLDAQEQSAEPADGDRLPAHTPGRVEFEHVSFAYEAGTPLIEDLSLVAEPGQTVAIVGPTGAGKTTLVNLILRFYELDAGRITLDGVDVATLDRTELRATIGMVLQDTWLFEGTIAENIGYGRLDATREEIVAAAQATYVERFVHSLPEGYETMISEDGESLSAGERQLITIARAFVAQPSLLILDEATSSVDTRTEVLVQRAMAALRQDRTSFVIAHRLSTIRDADLILVMEDGHIVEQGTHTELMDNDGLYRRLNSTQVPAAS